MRGLKGLTPLLLIGAAGMAWLLFLSEPGSHWLTSFLAPPAPTGPSVGKVISLDGHAKRVHGGDVQKLSAPLAQALELHDGDRFETDAGSHALLQMNSQDELEVQPLSSVTLQLWNDQDTGSPIYMTVLAGDLELKKPGVRGRAYVVREGRLYLPGQKAAKKAMALTVLRSAPLDMSLADSSAPAGDGKGDFEADPTAVAPSGDSGKPDASFTGDPETLSNEYIDEMIVARQGQLQKCWLGRLKDKPGLKGQIILQFEISRRGKVKDIKVADSSIADEPLQKCVMQVVERIAFRSFKGAEISLSYPIGFE
jgi:TonB family protein